MTTSLTGETFSIGGIDCPSAIETLRQAENYVEAGAEMLRIRFPREETLVTDYFHEILPRCPAPVLLMHQTSPASFGIAARPAATPEVLGEIAGLEKELLDDYIFSPFAGKKKINPKLNYMSSKPTAVFTQVWRQILFSATQIKILEIFVYT